MPRPLGCLYIPSINAPVWVGVEVVVTAPPVASMPQAVKARVLKGATAPTAPPNTAVPEVLLTVSVSTRGVDTESLSTAATMRMTAFAPLAVSVAFSPTVTAPV